MASFAANNNQVAASPHGIGILHEDLVFDVLLYLDSVSLAKVSRTSYFFHVLSRLILRKTPTWKTITTTFPEMKEKSGVTNITNIPNEAFVRCQLDNIKRVQASTSASLNTGFFFLNEQKSNYKIKEETSQALPALLPKDFVAIGAPCQSIASVDTFAGPKEGPQLASSVSLANIPECDRDVFNIVPGELEESMEDAFTRMTPKRGGEGWSVIMLFCTFSCQAYVEDYLGFLKKKHPKAEVIGGFVSGRDGIIIKDGELKRCGHILGMAIGGNVVYSSQVSRACKKISEVMTIQTLGNYNDEHEGEIGKLMSPTDGIVASGGVASRAVEEHDARMLYCGITKSEDEGFQLMDVRGLTRENGIAVAGGSKDLRVLGSKVCFFTLDPKSSSDDIRSRLAAAKRAASGRSKTVLGAVLVSCGARGENLYHEPNVEPTVFSEELGGVGMSGFFAGGEIGPEALAALPYDTDFRGETKLQGFTSVFGVFFVPEFVPTGKIISEALQGRKILF
ncbi:hypothetical protein TrRE_jg767 [Triparma retinervis]|uniref:FIST C-domain domain-containing protein n=1 Tax=Triparma retinervis TaxID=2557542 RepID=A0A9W6ZEV9_9STRA|nr:hypothetical protein TrRE_jg767 [Triparma retinervis]